MVRLAIVVEGETEVEFVDRVLAVHLLRNGIYTTPTSLRGRISVERLAGRMAELFWNFDIVTSLVDYYGFENKGARTVEQLEQDITQEVSRRMQRNWDVRKVISYVQRHEFEGLLFSEVNGFSNVPGSDPTALEQLESIRAQFPSPEDINDGPDTAPTANLRA